MTPHDGSSLWPPGTVILEERRFSHSDDDGQHAVVLQPRPTDDPNDPLNWSRFRKLANFGLVCLYVALVAEFINANSPIWDDMHQDVGYSYEILNDSYAAGCAALAVGSFLMIPLALSFGRRPLYLFSTVLQFGLSIWSAKMTTVADLMLINVLQCFFGSLAETIVQMTVADVFFVHERGRMNAVYVWVWLLASYMGMLIAGFVATGMGWRWVWWWNVIFFGGCIFLVFFCYEETKYLPKKDHILNVPIEESPENSPEKDEKSSTKEKNEKSPDTTHRPSSPDKNWHAVEQVHINHDIPLKTYRQRLAIFTFSPKTPSDGNSSTGSKDGPVSFYIKHMYQPIVILFTIPAVTFSALVYGILVALGDVMSTTMSTYLPQDPYNFSSSQIGLMALPRMIGVTIGAIIIGPLSDWFILVRSRRNNGIYDPEMRLWCVLPFLLFIPAGSLMFGIGLNNHVPWPVIAVGLAIYNVGVTPINSLVVTYLTDSYQDIIGDALVAVTIVRNCFSTAFIFALTPWIHRIGIKYVLVTIMLLACFVLSFFAVFIRWGKSFRGLSASRYEMYAKRQYKGRE